MPAAALAAGAVAGVVGAHSQAKAQKRQMNAVQNAAQPYDINGLFGNTSFDGKTASFIPSADAQGMFNNFGNYATNMLTGNSPTAGFQNFANDLGNNGLPGFFAGANAASMQTPDQAFGQYNGQMNNLFGTYSGLGMGALQNQQNMFGQAQGLLGRDTSALSQNFLDTLRQRAQPYNQQQMDMVANSAFNNGQLGGPGGRLALQQMLDQQNSQDLGFQNSALNFGQQQQGINTNAAQLFGNMGNIYGGQAMQYANALPQLAQNQYNTNAGFSDLLNNRGQQRLSNATGLFGFGNNLNTQDLNQAIAAFGAQNNLNTSFMNQLATGSNMATNQASAIAGGAPQGSPMGSFLGGAGIGLMQAGIGGMFAPQQQQTPSFSSAWAPANFGNNPSGVGLMSPGSGVMMTTQPVWQPYRP